MNSLERRCCDRQLWSSQRSNKQPELACLGLCLSCVCCGESKAPTAPTLIDNCFGTEIIALPCGEQSWTAWLIHVPSWEGGSQQQQQSQQQQIHSRSGRAKLQLSTSMVATGRRGMESDTPIPHTFVMDGGTNTPIMNQKGRSARLQQRARFCL